MLAFLEKNKNSQEWLDDFVYISVFPLMERGYTIIPFYFEELTDLIDFTESDICIGSVEACIKFFELNKVAIPKAINYPIELRKYLKRDIIETTFKESGENYPYFIKPSENIKLFNGYIVNNDHEKSLITDFYKVDDSTPIFKSSIIDFISEYRVFVSKGYIYGIKHYKGDFCKFIDVSVIKNMIKDYKDCPSAYTLDVGLTESGESLLVEVNDMWAIGSYGLDGGAYSLLCIRRMTEILTNNMSK